MHFRILSNFILKFGLLALPAVGILCADLILWNVVWWVAYFAWTAFFAKYEILSKTVIGTNWAQLPFILLLETDLTRYVLWAGASIWSAMSYLHMYKQALLVNRTMDPPVGEKIDYVEAMREMASEGERTYRGMIEVYEMDIEDGILPAPSEDSAVVPTGRGIYKARLFGALFMAMAYAKSGYSQKEVEEMLNIATAVALEPLLGQGAVRIDQEEAKAFTLGYVTSVFKSMNVAFKAGPLWLPSPKKEHRALADHLHDALLDSMGSERYTTEVRKQFAVRILCNTAEAMNHARQWIVSPLARIGRWFANGHGNESRRPA